MNKRMTPVIAIMMGITLLCTACNNAKPTTTIDSTTQKVESKSSSNEYSMKEIQDEKKDMREATKQYAIDKAAEETNRQEEKKKQEELSASKVKEIEQKVKDYLGDEYYCISIDYLDLSSGTTLKINNNQIWHTASTIKVPIVMLIMDMINEGTIKETDTMLYNEETDYEQGAGELQNMDKSSPINIMTLCEYAIRYSDNIAVNMLMRKVGFSNIVPSLNSKLGVQWGEKPNQASASLMTAVLKHLYDGSNAYYAKEINWLENTIFHDRIDKYLTDVNVAHKIGDYNEYTHDVGIVYSEKPYIVSIYSCGLSNPDEKIAQISKMIYETR